MNNQLHEFARDSSCLLCLTPENGGTWYCPTRPPKLRDFSKPYNWDTLQQALRDLPWNDDYHFEFEFTIDDMLENGRNCIMYQSEGRIAFFMDKDARGSRFTIGTFSFSGGAYIYTTFQPSLAGKHKVIVTVIGDMLRVTVDNVIYEQTGERVASSAYDRAVTTSGPIIFHNISLTNDTSQTVLWTSAYTDLYDTLIPQPSAIPYNFAENAKAFYDCQAVMREALDPTHDYKFLLDFEITKDSGESSVFYAGATNFPFGVYVYSDHTIRVFSNLLRAASNPTAEHTGSIAYSGDTRLQGRHIIELNIEGDAMRTFLNGSEVAYTSNTVRTGTVAVGLPNCNSGYVYKIQITDLTDNQVVWSYPSEAERVRLITKTNVRTDRGAFEAADETQPARVDTALDLRGNSTSKTFWARGYFPKHENNGLLYVHPMIEQGDTIYGTDSWVFRVTVWEDYRAPSGVTALRCDFCDADNAARLCHIRITDDFFNTTHDIAYVIDFQANGAFCSVYIDGSIATQANFTASAFGTGATSAMSANVGIRRDPITNYLSGNSVECALVFDRALSAAEIAALTSHSIGGI